MICRSILFADQIIQDSRTGMISAINIWAVIDAEKIPVQIRPFAIMVIIDIEPSDEIAKTVTISLKQSGIKLLSDAFPVPDGAKSRITAGMVVQNIQIESLDDLIAEVEIDGKIIGSFPQKIQLPHEDKK